MQQQCEDAVQKNNVSQQVTLMKAVFKSFLRDEAVAQHSFCPLWQENTLKTHCMEFFYPTF